MPIGGLKSGFLENWLGRTACGSSSAFLSSSCPRTKKKTSNFDLQSKSYGRFKFGPFTTTFPTNPSTLHVHFSSIPRPIRAIQRSYLNAFSQGTPCRGRISRFHSPWPRNPRPTALDDLANLTTFRAFAQPEIGCRQAIHPTFSTTRTNIYHALNYYTFQTHRITLKNRSKLMQTLTTHP